MSSISTDGGSNMIGKTNGMVTQLRRLIQREYGSQMANFHSIWCLCHRLNLVIRDFQRAENIKMVFGFCDWFTTKRKAVVYKKWLKQNHPDDFFPKIPTPSETRWSFYKDVVHAVLAQSEQIEDYLRTDHEFASFCDRHGVPSTREVASRPFFKNIFIRAHFLFAKSLLKKICSVNQKMQERFSMLPHSWILLNGLKNDLKNCLEEMQAGNFEHFPFLQNVESAQIPSFETILQRCLLNMETRFPCPSKSFNMRHANEHLNTSQNSIDVGLLKTIQQSCTLFELVGLFIFPDDLIKGNNTKLARFSAKMLKWPGNFRKC